MLVCRDTGLATGVDRVAHTIWDVRREATPGFGRGSDRLGAGRPTQSGQYAITSEFVTLMTVTTAALRNPAMYGLFVSR